MNDISNSSDGTVNANTGNGQQNNIVNNGGLIFIGTEELLTFLDEIIGYIEGQSNSSTNSDSEEARDFTEITKKIIINFETNESKLAFVDRYSKALEFNYIELIKRHLSSMDSLKRDGVIFFIQQEYKKILGVDTTNSKVIEFNNLEKLSRILVPPARVNNMKHFSISSYLVLCVFELCDIGLKTENELSQGRQLFLLEM